MYKYGTKGIAALNWACPNMTADQNGHCDAAAHGGRDFGTLKSEDRPLRPCEGGALEPEDKRRGRSGGEGALPLPRAITILGAPVEAGASVRRRGDGAGHAAHGGDREDAEGPRSRRRGPGRSRASAAHWSMRPRRKARRIGSPMSRPGRGCWPAKPMRSRAPGGRRSCLAAITAWRWVRSAASPATRPRRGASCSSCGSTPIRTSTRR